MPVPVLAYLCSGGLSASAGKGSGDLIQPIGIGGMGVTELTSFVL